MKNQPILSSTWNRITKHPVLTLTCVAAGMMVAAVYIYITPSKYTSTAVLEVKSTSTTPIVSFPFGSGKTALTEELTTPSFIANAIADKVDPVTYLITQDYQTRENSYSFPYTVKHNVMSAKFKEQTYRIETLNDNTYMLTSVIHGITRTKTAKFDEELIDQDLALTISHKKNQPYKSKELFLPAVYSFKIQSPASIATYLLAQHNGIIAEEKNGLITLSVTHENSTKAIQITNALANNLLSARNNGNILPGTSMASIDKQLIDLSTQLEATESQIANYKRENNITEITIDTQKHLDVLKNLQLQKSQLELSLVALNNTSNYLRKNREINNSNVEYGTISDPVFSEQIALLNSKYEAKESGSETATTVSEIEALKVSIAERILNTRKKTTIQINKTNQEIAQVKQQLSVIPEKANVLNTLDRKLDLDKKVYELLAEKRAQFLITGTTLTTGAQLIKPASEPTSPAFPSAMFIFTCAVVCGLIISIPVCTVAEKWQSRKLTNRQEIDKQSRIPFIGAITKNNENDMAFDSSISALCTRVLLRQDTKIITFASANKGEGKTFIATHFAQAFAAMDKKVLVIDMNADNPKVATHFDVTPERSLAQVLEGSCDIHDAICITSYPNLDVLECGTLSSGVNSFLASKMRDSVLDSLKKHYDLIVTDTPDIGTQIDAIPLMKMSDLNLFIVNANTTRKESLMAAEQINKDYNLPDFNYLLNSVKRFDNQHPGTGRRSRVRNLNKSNTTTKEAYVPSLLRKIALWFY